MSELIRICFSDVAYFLSISPFNYLMAMFILVFIVSFIKYLTFN